jgi:hypothetical protein
MAESSTDIFRIVPASRQKTNEKVGAARRRGVGQIFARNAK